jgi:hypothetical protein
MKRSKQSWSHNHNTTFDMGELIPLAWYDVFPATTIQLQSAMLVRTNPLLTPLYHPVYANIVHMFCPYRLIWDDWEDFITGGKDGNQTPTHPYIDFTAPAAGSLADYLGLPSETYGHTESLNALPFRAYALFYNEHIMDTELQTALTIDTTSGADTTTSIDLKNVNWAKDYFVGARSAPQLGTQTTVPVGDEAVVNVTPDISAGSATLDNSGADTPGFITSYNATTGKVYADLSTATGVDINDLRLALSIQRFQEARQRYGSRYVEYLRYLGVKGGRIDARLQRPEILAHGRQSIAFSEVVSTADSGTDIVGTLRGHGIAATRTNKVRRFIEEHGIVMTLAYVRPKAMYMNGIHKKWLKTTKEEYFNKELQYVGDQEVENREIYAKHATPQGTFGYVGRYDEYRYHPSFVSGNMAESTYNTWHLGRDITSTPALNSSFITCSPTKRVFANTSDDALIVASNHKTIVRVPMTKTNRPKTF